MRLRCAAVRDETPDVRTWVFTEADGQPISFLPGQAVTLALPGEGGTLHRTFSIASSALRPERIELTVKAAPDGRATAWMRRNLQLGMTVEAAGPHGRFVLPCAPGPLALVSAGSGATPLMAMLRTLADSSRLGTAHADAVDVAWVHAARTPGDVLFGAELAELQGLLPRLTVAVTVARPSPGWFGYRGRAGRRLLSVMVPDLARRDVMCCGPAAFMDEVGRVHAAEGGVAGRFRTERFAPLSTPSPIPASPDADDAYTVTFAGRSFPAVAAETVLQAAVRANVVIPCGCGSGLCGTCRVRLHSGEVSMRHAGGLLAEEEAQGWILACSSRPRSDLVLGP
jgi:ferredoxin-NADP reductase